MIKSGVILGTTSKILGEPPEGYLPNDPDSMGDLYIHWDDRIAVEVEFKDSYNQNGGESQVLQIPVKRINIYPNKIAIERSINFCGSFEIIDSAQKYRLLGQLKWIR